MTLRHEGWHPHSYDHQGSSDRIELAHASLDLVSIRGSDGRIGRTLSWWFDRLDMHLEPEAALVPPDLAVAGIHQQASQPGIKAVGVAESGQVTPGRDEGLCVASLARSGSLRTSWAMR